MHLRIDESALDGSRGGTAVSVIDRATAPPSGPKLVHRLRVSRRWSPLAAHGPAHRPRRVVEPRPLERRGSTFARSTARAYGLAVEPARDPPTAGSSVGVPRLPGVLGRVNRRPAPTGPPCTSSNAHDSSSTRADRLSRALPPAGDRGSFSGRLRRVARTWRIRISAARSQPAEHGEPIDEPRLARRPVEYVERHPPCSAAAGRSRSRRPLEALATQPGSSLELRPAGLVDGKASRSRSIRTTIPAGVALACRVLERHGVSELPRSQARCSHRSPPARLLRHGIGGSVAGLRQPRQHRRPVVGPGDRRLCRAASAATVSSQ